MNILHHKSWHVRNKDNIERVRRDEENARKEEEERLRKVALAESEARTGILRERAKARQRNDDTVYEDVATQQATPSKHINFFADEEQGVKKGGVNDEHEKERKEEQEKREKAIGLLTYLGQSAVEGQTVKPWYFTAPVKNEPSTSVNTSKECDRKRKSVLDPMHMMSKYMSTKRKVEGRPVEPAAKRQRLNPTIKSEGEKSAVVEEVASTSESRDKKHKSKHKKKKKHKIKKSKGKRKHRDKSEPESSKDAQQQPSQSSSRSIEQLRAERLQRELAERQKSKQLFSKLRGEKSVEELELDKKMDDRSRGYNSQFNPDLVRKPKKKQDWHNMV